MWKPVQSVLSKVVVRVIGPALLVVVAAAGATDRDSASSCPQPATDPSRPLHYSGRQLQTLLGSARTIEDHEHLAAYFRGRECEFRAKEAYEQQVLTEYLKDPARYPSKYPTRGDTARQLASYYRIQAQKSAGLALEHDRLAADLRTRE